jgi:hypothetical protein
MQEIHMRLEKNQNSVKEELAGALGLKKEDDKRTALNRFKQRFRDAEAAALARFQGQEIVFNAAVDSGLPAMLDHVWAELQALDRKSASKDREPFLSTAVPLLVASRFEAAGNPARKDEIINLVEARVEAADPEVIANSARQLVNAGDLTGCTGQLNAAMNPHGTLHELALRLACRLVNQGKVADAISFCSSIKDAAIKEDGLFFTAALAARSGKGEAYWKAASGLGPSETTAVCAGLAVGFNSRPAQAK